MADSCDNGLSCTCASLFSYVIEDDDGSAPAASDTDFTSAAEEAAAATATQEVYSGDYGDAAPTFTPSNADGGAVARDAVTGRVWWWNPITAVWE
jgi:hypothetical protein